MYDDGKVDARDAVREAGECCARIASVLEVTTSEAEQIGDREFVERLAAAKAAAARAGELIAKLADMFEEQPKLRQSSN